ncbi:MAG: non-homologous end-joining DNA ligase [Pseudomonadota bacterium]|nr:non-homologous end-joining DNA ligase [Pseudomonadota bacterium]
MNPDVALGGSRRPLTTPSNSAPGAAAATGAFVVQKHAARTLHYDFRLELDGVLKSWAIPKGPSLDPTLKRMAVEVEDHPLAYGGFEGVIAPGHYGAGRVEVWDRGQWRAEGDARQSLLAGRLVFELEGEKLQGRWTLLRLRPRAAEKQPTWLLMKAHDAFARSDAEYDVVAEAPDSVLARPGRPRAAQPARTSRGARAEAGVTHPDRVIDAVSGATKAELAAYFERAAPQLLVHLKQRPVALVRAPAGVARSQFFQKHAGAGAMPGTRRLDPALDPGHDALLVIGSARGLRSAAQLNVVEIHTWNMTARTIQKPDRMVFDLDPGEGVTWPQVREGALAVRDFLAQIGLVALVKTSGGKGLHLVVPLAPRWDWQRVRAFSQAVVARMAEVAPERFALKSGPRNRIGKIFIDYLRNGWGATTAAAWSPRARPGLGISVPFDWTELGSVESGAHWQLRNIDARLGVGNAPWDTALTRQTLTRAMKALDIKAPLA